MTGGKVPDHVFEAALALWNNDYATLERLRPALTLLEKEQNRRRDVRSAQPEQNRRSAVHVVDTSAPPIVLNLQVFPDDHEPSVEVRLSKYNLFHACCRPGETDRNPWELWARHGDGGLKASCTSREAAIAAGRLLNGWCE